MNGKTRIFNVTKGVGFIDAENGEEYFVHISDVRAIGGDADGVPRFQALVPGSNVSFEPKKHAGRIQAGDVVPEKSGIKINPQAPRLSLKSGTAKLRIDSAGRIYAVDGKPVAPTFEAQGHFRAYHVGFASVNGFDFKVPSSEPNRAFVLLDPEKNPRRPAEGGSYTSVAPGSYLMKIESSGEVTVWNIGRRNDMKSRPGGDMWVILEVRYSHTYQFSDNPTAEEILAQTPTSGKDRDNDGFIRGILRGIELINAASGATAHATK